MSYHDADILDRHAYADTPVHRLDARAKVMATFIFILTVVSYGKYAIAPLIPFVLFPLSMAILGFVPARLIIKRLLIASPFIVFIGLFNPLLDRTPAMELGGVTITGGWISFISILLRGFLCIFAAIVLIATTSFPRIIQALRSLGVPRALVVQLMLLYRYLFLLIEEAGRMSRAGKLRAGVSKTSLSTAASMLSSLLVRTVDRGDSVWMAMKARGFEGELKTARREKWMPRDTAFLCIILFFCAILRIYPITYILGKWGASF